MLPQQDAAQEKNLSLGLALPSLGISQTKHPSPDSMQVCSLAVRLLVLAQQVRFVEAPLNKGTSYHFENQAVVSYLNKSYLNCTST